MKIHYSEFEFQCSICFSTLPLQTYINRTAIETDMYMQFRVCLLELEFVIIYPNNL